MKSFIISIVMLLLIVCGIVFNSIYLTNLTEEMLDLAGDIPENLDELTILWEKNHKIIGITVNNNYIYDITTSLISARRLYEGSCEGESEAARDILYEAILRLHEIEKFSIDNII